MWLSMLLVFLYANIVLLCDYSCFFKRMLRSKKLGTQHAINDDAFYATCCDSFVLKIYLDHKFQ